MVRFKAAKLRAQRGFTLIEIMIVVAVIAILAIVVVPTFFRETRKTKGATEVTPMFAEISVKQEQYKADTGLYLDTAECPSTTSPAGVAASTCTAAADWVALRINPPEAVIRCKYDVEVGTGAGVVDPGGFTFTAPAANWFYILATCDMDGSGPPDATYFTSSVDTAIQKLNEGN